MIGSTATSPGVIRSNFGKYARRFGWRRALGLYSTVKWGRGLVDVRIPGLAAPVAVRAGTSDREALTQVFVESEYDTRYPGLPRFIIDAGANVGYASVWFANVYPGAAIVAVEPDADNCAVLERNVAPYRGVRVVRAGVWPREASLAIENPSGKSWSFRVREAAPGERGFPAVSIAGLLEASGLSVIDILKLDVEGTERELFSDAGCDRWLSRTNMLFVETHDRYKPGCEAALAAAVARHGFRRSQEGENVVLIRERLLE